ncbi:hypothetical protein RB195_010348 [Necator americanus]|uniref:Uncharacterized protein n=1 Tax=Necator americanus TaxID=51031 RepID=A0ABR1CXZ0_NECAM
MTYGSVTWARPSTVMERLDCMEGKLLRRLLGYFWPRRPADRLVQRVLRSLSGSSWKKLPGRKRKFWTEMVKEETRLWNTYEWIDSVQALAENRKGWAELCSRMAHLGEDAGIASGDDISPPIKQTDVEPRYLNRYRPIEVVSYPKESMFIAIFVFRRTPIPPTPLLSHIPRNSSPVSYSGVVQWATSPRLGQSEYVILKLPGLRHQIFNGRIRCKRTGVISTDRYPRPFPLR